MEKSNVKLAELLAPGRVAASERKVLSYDHAALPIYQQPADVDDQFTELAFQAFTGTSILFPIVTFQVSYIPL